MENMIIALQKELSETEHEKKNRTGKGSLQFVV
jgi:hypothetical protein